MINKTILDEFNKIDIPLKKYAIFGSGPMAIRDMRECRDLDLVVTDELYQKLLQEYPETKPGNICIGKYIEVWSEKESLIDNPRHAIEHSDLIQGYKFITLTDLIKWKRKMGRPKDKKDIKLIKQFVKTNRPQTRSSFRSN